MAETNILGSDVVEFVMDGEAVNRFSVQLLEGFSAQEVRVGDAVVALLLSVCRVMTQHQEPELTPDEEMAFVQEMLEHGGLYLLKGDPN